MTETLTVPLLCQRLLSPLWLRPESALWYAYMLATAHRLLGTTTLPHPALEYGCMDGVNTVALLGGEFAPEFDVYAEVAWDTASHRRATLADDYFNRYSADTPPVPLRRPPADQFDLGVDWKEAHLAKARRTGAFRDLALIDPRTAMACLPDAHFAFIWAPNIYWAEDLPNVLRELRRTLHPQGRIITIGPDSRQLEFMLRHQADAATLPWLEMLDRGRYTNSLRHSRSRAEWAAIFAAAGLRIARHQPFIPAAVARVYDVGLRPLFPVLMNLRETLQRCCPDELPRLKQRWLETLTRHLLPLCDEAWQQRLSPGHAWHCFELVPD